MHVIRHEALSAEAHYGQAWTVAEQEQPFRVCLLARDDPRQMEYQRLRARIFGEQLHWNVVITDDGREVDRFDLHESQAMHAYTVYQLSEGEEDLLSGVRVCVLAAWEDSMVMQEFQAAGLFSPAVLAILRERSDGGTLLEITRLCVQRRRLHTHATRMHLELAQHLAYAAVYHMAEQTGRSLVLAVVSAGYLRVLHHAGFVVQVCHAQQLSRKVGSALTIIDLPASIHAMRALGKHAQVARLLVLCQDARWVDNQRPSGMVTMDQ